MDKKRQGYNGLFGFSPLFFGPILVILYWIDYYGHEALIIWPIIGTITSLLYVRWAFIQREDFLDRTPLLALYTSERRFRKVAFLLIGLAITFLIFRILLLGVSVHLLPSPQVEATIVPILLSPFSLVVLYYQPLNTKGEIKVEFEQLISTWDNFEERQKWMVRAFKRLETALRTGLIDISHHDLCYQLNTSDKKIYEINGDLDSMKNWFLKKEKDTSILSYIRNLSPNIEFKRRRVRPRLHLFKALADNERYIGFLVFIILIVVQQKSLVAILEELTGILL